jgi:hypothetical protein
MYVYYRDSINAPPFYMVVALVSDQKVPCHGCLLLYTVE